MAKKRFFFLILFLFMFSSCTQEAREKEMNEFEEYWLNSLEKLDIEPLVYSYSDLDSSISFEAKAIWNVEKSNKVNPFSDDLFRVYQVEHSGNDDCFFSIGILWNKDDRENYYNSESNKIIGTPADAQFYNIVKKTFDNILSDENIENNIKEHEAATLQKVNIEIENPYGTLIINGTKFYKNSLKYIYSNENEITKVMYNDYYFIFENNRSYFIAAEYSESEKASIEEVINSINFKRIYENLPYENDEYKIMLEYPDFWEYEDYNENKSIKLYENNSNSSYISIFSTDTTDVISDDNPDDKEIDGLLQYVLNYWSQPESLSNSINYFALLGFDLYEISEKTDIEEIMLSGVAFYKKSLLITFSNSELQSSVELYLDFFAGSANERIYDIYVSYIENNKKICGDILNSINLDFEE